jgi:hypothetical protein
MVLAMAFRTCHVLERSNVIASEVYMSFGDNTTKTSVC